MSDAFRCSTAALDRRDELAGTASNVRAFLLVEHVGPWPVDAFRDSRLAHGLGPAIRRAANAAKVRPLMIRRPTRRGEHPDHRPTRVFVANVTPRRGFVETATLSRVDDVVDLDLAAVARGESAGLTPYTEPFYAVCTQGRHDACCAERGRPLARALADLRRDQVWECTHVGGDRFAGNVLVLPGGLYYGQVLPAEASALVAATESGEVLLDRLRGPTCFTGPVQFAGITLRRELGVLGLRDLLFVGKAVDGDRVLVTFDVEGSGRHMVEVVVGQGPAAQLTCRAAHPRPVPTYSAVRVEPA